MAEVPVFDKGDFISVFWEDGCWYDGMVLKFDTETKICTVQYEDGERQYVNLKSAKVKAKDRMKCVSVQELLLETEIKLPMEAVVKSVDRWWELWRLKVTETQNSKEEDALAALKARAMELILQINEKATNTWWSDNEFEWTTSLIKAEDEEAVNELIKTFTSKAMDWDNVRNIWPSMEDEAPGNERGKTKVNEGQGNVESPKNVPSSSRISGKGRSSVAKERTEDEPWSSPSESDEDEEYRYSESEEEQRRSKRARIPIARLPAPSSSLEAVPYKKRGRPVKNRGDSSSKRTDSDAGTEVRQETPARTVRTLSVEEGSRPSPPTRALLQQRTPGANEGIRQKKQSDQPGGTRRPKASPGFTSEEAEIVTWIVARFKEKKSAALIYDTSQPEPPSGLLALISVSACHTQSKPFLIVVPKDDERWTTALPKWDSRLKISVNDNDNVMAVQEPFNVVITTPALAKRDSAFLAKTEWAAIIVDDIFRLKRWWKDYLEDLSKWPADVRLLLAGRALKDNEFHSVLNFLEPEVLRNPDQDLRPEIEARMRILTLRYDEEDSISSLVNN